MKDFDRYAKELYFQSKKVCLKDVIESYQLPNNDELHSMICGYGKTGEYFDTALYDCSESIDYFKYEKELWKLEKPK